MTTPTPDPSRTTPAALIALLKRCARALVYSMPVFPDVERQVASAIRALENQPEPPRPAEPRADMTSAGSASSGLAEPAHIRAVLFQLCETIKTAHWRGADVVARDIYETFSRPHQRPVDRDALGRLVREAWVRWAKQHPTPKQHWLLPYDELSESDKEVDRQIGETVAHSVLNRSDHIPIGTRVEKHTGEYHLDGVVRAAFRTGAGELRYVVEHEPIAPGLLHIYSASQIREID